MNYSHVKGKKKEDIVLFALTTCPWCEKTKKLFNKGGIDYKFIDVDTLEGDEKKEVVAEIKRWNPDLSFPTLVINNSESIIGYDEERLTELAS